MPTWKNEICKKEPFGLLSLHAPVAEQGRWGEEVLVEDSCRLGRVGSRKGVQRYLEVRLLNVPVPHYHLNSAEIKNA